jgi:hypothetical protein
LRAGDDVAAQSLAGQSGIPAAMLTIWELGPRGTASVGDGALALSCVASLAGGTQPDCGWISSPEVVGLVADAVELAAAGGAGHPWQRGIMALDPAKCPGVAELLRARALEGAGLSDEARALIGSSLHKAPGLVPAVRDAMEYELCAGNWAQAFELASPLGHDDKIAGPLLRPLEQLRRPAAAAERAGRNQPCPCGSGRKYKACCRAKDLETGMHPLPLRAPALYAMIATYAQRAGCRPVTNRAYAAAIGAPQAAMLALDLAIFDGGAASRFLASRGDLLRADERELLQDWLRRPVDMYEVTRVHRGSDLALRSMTGGASHSRQRDRLFSLSVHRLDIVIGRLLPDGERGPGGELRLRALGGMALLDRARRETALKLFPDGPAGPGNDPVFPLRLLSQFPSDSTASFQTTDGDEYRFCETTIDVAGAHDVWDRLTSMCVPAAEPPVTDLASYDAFVAGLPPRFWTRNSDSEIEYVGLLGARQLTNLGTVERTRRGFKVTANSVRRAAVLTATVLATAADAGRSGKITNESVKTAEELLSGQRADDGPDGRDSMCLRLGIDPDLVTVPPRELILEEQFLPMEHTLEGEAAAREITRELATRTMLEVRDEDGYTLAEAVTAGGAAKERAAAIVDDCEWRISRAEPGTAGAMPLPDDLRQRAGLPLKPR